jgi:hypothetical protein
MRRLVTGSCTAGIRNGPTSRSRAGRNCLALGGDFATCLKCVDLLDVVLSGVKGAMGLGVLGVAKIWRNAAKTDAAMERLMGPAGRVLSENNRRAITEKAVKETAATAVAKAATPPVACEDNDVCKK